MDFLHLFNPSKPIIVQFISRSVSLRSRVWSQMTFVFEPSILQNLGLDADLQAKDITTDPSPSGCQYLLRPLRSTDYGIHVNPHEYF